MVSTKRPGEFVIITPSGTKQIMIEMGPSPENYRMMLSRIIEGTNDADARTWAKSELIRIQGVEEWHTPRYQCIGLHRQEQYVTVQCVECAALSPGPDTDEDQMLSSEFFIHFGDDWLLMFLDNVNDTETLNYTKMREAAVKRAILDEGWGHDDNYHDGSFKAMSLGKHDGS